MPDLFDDFSLPIECPDCGKETEQKWSRIKNDPDLACGNCGTTIRINAEQLRELEGTVEKLVNNMRKRFS